MEFSNQLTPFLSFNRAQWAELRKSVPLKLTEQDLKPLLGFNEELSLDEVSTIYLPLTRLINYYIDENLRRQTVLHRFLGRNNTKIPYVISIAGSVAVGKAHLHGYYSHFFPIGQKSEKLNSSPLMAFSIHLRKLKQNNLLQKKVFPFPMTRPNSFAFLLM